MMTTTSDNTMAATTPPLDELELSLADEFICVVLEYVIIEVDV